MAETRQIESVEDLQKLLNAQSEAIAGLHNLVQAMHTTMQLYVALVDVHQHALESAGIMKPKPAAEAPIVH